MEHRKEIWGLIWKDLNGWAGPRLGAGTVWLLPHPDMCYPGWMAWSTGSPGQLSGVSTCGFPPCLGFSLHGTGFRGPHRGSMTFKTLFQKTQGPFHHTAWPKLSQAALTWGERTQSQSLDGTKVKEVGTFFLLPTRTWAPRHSDRGDVTPKSVHDQRL